MRCPSRRGQRGLRLLFAASALTSLFFSSKLHALELTVHVGPPSVGNGGSNPISIPPLNLSEYEFTFITQNNFESNIAITPGLLFGKRDTLAGGFYVAGGGGLVIDANGTGPGVYTSFGLNRGDKLRFNLEYKQAIGFSFNNSTMLSPYAIRIGVSYVFSK